MKPDNCFRLGPLWEEQQWQEFFSEGRTTAFLEYQEGGPRIFVKWVNRNEVLGLVLGWCPPGTWLPTVSLPFGSCDVTALAPWDVIRWFLQAGGVGATVETWPVELCTLLLVNKPYLATSPSDLLQEWRERMVEAAQKAVSERKNSDAPFVSLDWAELAERPRTDVRRVFTQCGLNREVVKIKWGAQAPSLILHFASFGKVRFGWMPLHSAQIVCQDGETHLPNNNFLILSDLVPIGLGAPKEQVHPLVQRLFDEDVKEVEVRSILNAMASAVRTGNNLLYHVKPTPKATPEPAPEQPSVPKYGWTLTLSNPGDGHFAGHVEFCQLSAEEGGPSRKMGTLTFNLNAEDWQYWRDLVGNLTQENPLWVEGTLAQLSTFMRIVAKK